MTLSPSAEAALSAHAWPVQSSANSKTSSSVHLIMAPGNTIEPQALNLVVRPTDTTLQPLRAAPERGATTALPEGEKRADNMKDLEREHILRTLAEVGGSRKKAIERLGISERTLRYKLQQYRDEGLFQD